jgi:hypothetical protein
LFAQVKRETPLGGDIAQEVLSKLFQQIVGEDVANIGFDMVNGTSTSLEKLRTLLEQYGDDFTPNLNIQWEDISIETLMAKAELEAKWAFNIAPITRKIEGVSYMSQLSAEAEGRTILNQSMMEGSRTGKAAEADLMFLIAKSPSVEGQEEESPLRHVNIVKNKLNGWHGMVNCELNYLTARYEG